MNTLLKHFAISVLAISLIALFIVAQTPKNSDKDKAPTAPIASTINDETELKEWNTLQIAKRENQAVLDQLIFTARQAKYKTADTKAQLWADLEIAFLRGQRDEEADADLLAKFQSKYKCPDCEVKVAPDNKTLIIKPKATGSGTVVAQ